MASPAELSCTPSGMRTQNAAVPRSRSNAATRSSTGWTIDVIVGVDGERVKSYDDLYNALEAKAAGEKVSLSVLRVPGDEVITIETELVEL